MTSARASRLPHRRFLVAFALANVGGVIGWLPLMNVLLPLKAEVVSGVDYTSLLGMIAVIGGFTASTTNLAFGWASDRSFAAGRGRRVWIVIGTVLMFPAYLAIAWSSTPLSLTLAMIGYQVAMNALLAPLMAVMADEVPDHVKGVVGGLMSFGSPTASGLVTIIVLIPGLGEAGRLMAVPALVTICVFPLLVIHGPRDDAVIPPPVARAAAGRRFSLIWLARLLIQAAGAVVSIYLLLYFRTLDDADPALPARVAGVLTVAFLLPVPLAVAIGRRSDRDGRREPFLLATAVFAATGLVGMAMADGFVGGAAAFLLYASGTSVFLALLAAHATEMLPHPGRRGWDMGIINLTNTLPTLAGPVLAWTVADRRNLDPLLLALSALTLTSGVIVLIAGRHTRTTG